MHCVHTACFYIFGLNRILYSLFLHFNIIIDWLDSVMFLGWFNCFLDQHSIWSFGH